eukprot:2166364-Prymnesium_polylepis.2
MRGEDHGREDARLPVVEVGVARKEVGEGRAPHLLHLAHVGRWDAKPHLGRASLHVVGRVEVVVLDVPAEEGVPPADVHHGVVDAGDQRRVAKQRAPKQRVHHARSRLRTRHLATRRVRRGQLALKRHVRRIQRARQARLSRRVACELGQQARRRRRHSASRAGAGSGSGEAAIREHAPPLAGALRCRPAVVFLLDFVGEQGCTRTFDTRPRQRHDATRAREASEAGSSRQEGSGHCMPPRALRLLSVGARASP